MNMLDVVLEEHAEDGKVFMCINGYTKRGFYDELKKRSMIPLDMYHTNRNQYKKPISYEYFTRLLTNDPKTSIKLRLDIFLLIESFIKDWRIQLENNRVNRKGKMLELSKDFIESIEKGYTDYTKDQVLQYKLENFGGKDKYIDKRPVIDVSYRSELEKIYQNTLEKME